MKITKIIPLVSLLGLALVATSPVGWAEEGQGSDGGSSDSGGGSDNGDSGSDGDSGEDSDDDSNFGFDDECGSGTANGHCNDGGDSGPSPEEEDADEIKSSIGETFPRIWESITSWGSSADQEASETNAQTQSALSANTTTQTQSSQIAHDGTTTGCPVELYSGCKVTRENDFEHPLLSLTRQHRLTQGSAWSLGAGWHSALDTRILWGVDIDIAPQIAANQQVVSGYQTIINEIEAEIVSLNTIYADRIGINQPGVQELIAEKSAELQAAKQPYVVKLNAAQKKLDELVAAKAISDGFRARNVYSADSAFPQEYEIGVYNVKWVTPQGARELFKLNPVTSAITAQSGNRARFERGANDSVTIITPAGERYQYNRHGFLTRIEANDGRWVEIARDSEQRAMSLTDELGRTLTFSYSGQRLTSMRDQAGRVAQYRYQGGKLSEVIGFDGEVHRYQYQYAANPLALTQKADGEGNAANYQYRQQNGKTVVDVQIDADGNEFHYEYDFANQTTTVINRNGSRTRYQYDDNNRITSRVYESEGSEVRMQYDPQGNLLVEYDELGEATTYGYDEHNQLVSITDPEGRATELVRDELGRILSTTNGAGESTQIDYGPEGRVETVTLPDGSVIDERWQDNLLVERIDEAGNTTLFEYDALGYPTRIETFGATTQSGDAFVRTMQYDAIGRVQWVSEGSESTPEAQWRTTRYDYQTEDGRSLDVPTRIIDPLGRESVMRYNTNGQVIYHKDFSGVETHYTYTARDKVATKRVVMPSAQGSQEYTYDYRYDAENNLVQATQPNGSVWRYQYDTRNRLIRSYIEGTQVSKTFSYDAAGHRLTETDSTGNTTAMSYYADGQVEAVTNPLGGSTQYHYDGAGRLASVYDNERGAYTTHYQRNELGHIIQSTDGNQNSTQFGVNPLGYITSTSLPNSSVERINREIDWRGNPIEQRDAVGGEHQFEYNAFGQVTRVTDSEGGEARYEYDALGRQTLHINAAGLKTTWQYDQQPTQLVVTQTETDTNQSQVYLSSRRTSEKTYDLLGRLIGYQDALGQTWTFDYNSQDLLRLTTNPDGSTIAREYNLAGQMIAEVMTTHDGEQRGSYYIYDGEGRVLTEQLPHYPLGTVNRYQYNALGQVSEVTLPDGSSYSYHYDAAGRQTATYNPLGHGEHWQYDGNDNVLSYTDREGFTWAYSYTADNQVSEVADPVNGYHAPTIHQYDDMGRLVSTRNPLGQQTRQVRDTLGRLTQRIDEAGNATRFQLDKAGRAVRVTNRLGDATTQQFDAFNQLTVLTDPMGNTTAFQYDALGRLINQRDALNHQEQWAYNYRNQVAQYTNQRNQSTAHQYNGFGNLTVIEQANGATTRYQYDAADKLTQVTSPLGATQSFDYDELARLTGFTNELGEHWRYDYNLAGQVTTAYQPEHGTDISYRYDPRGNVTEREFRQQGQWVSEQLSYDGLGRLASIHSPSLTEQYHYNGASQLTQVDDELIGQSFTYAYNAIGERISSQMTDSETVTYQRNNEGHITHIERETDQGTQVFTLNYDANGRLTDIEYPNHSRRTLDYDALNRITHITIEQEEYKGNRWRGNWETIEVLEYRYDEAGNVTAQNRKTEQYGSDQWAYFEYDQVNRLIAADYPSNEDIDYVWDNAGNLVEKQTKTHSFTYRYNDANQLLEMKGHRLPGFSCDYAQCEDDEYSDSQWFSYQYDANGYLTDVSNNTEQQTYQHDALGRMTNVTNPDGTAVTYGYDARSRRVMTERTMSFDAEPDTTSNSHKGNNGKGKGQSSTSSVTQSGVIALYSHYDGRQEQGQWQQAGHGFEVFRSLTLLPQANLPYAQVLHQSLSDSKSQLVKASGTKGADVSNLFIHHDHLGSAIQVLDDTGTQAMRLGYSPFGQVYRKHNDKTQWKINAGVNANKQLGQLMPYQYTGGYTDGNTGLVHLDARWYNPHTSRFAQPDYWNLKNTYLPTEIQHELMRFTRLNTNQLLRDPSQQLAYGYVSGNPLSWVDPWGLVVLVVSSKVDVTAGVGAGVQEGLAFGYSESDLKINFVESKNLKADTTYELVGGLKLDIHHSIDDPKELESERSVSISANIATPSLIAGGGASFAIDNDLNKTTSFEVTYGPSLSSPVSLSTNITSTTVSQDLTEIPGKTLNRALKEAEYRLKGRIIEQCKNK